MKKKGFTLIEMMMALSIFSLFVGFLYNAYFTQIKENNSFNTRLDLKYNGNKAMNLITNELRSNINVNFTSGSNGNVNQITTTDGNMLIDLIGGTELSNLTFTSQNTLVDNSNSNPVVLCKGITSIKMEFGSAAKNEGELIIITIDLQLKNDRYTVTTAVNINK
jgi:prepilin-type N-terminal cleavage/methylation domain-containing protein